MLELQKMLKVEGNSEFGNIKLSEEQMMERQKIIARLKENEWIQIFS